MKKDIRLYNVMFPIWFFFLFPSYLWLIILPVNFVVDSLVIWLSAKRQGIDDRIDLWKRSILSVWFIGFLCDFLGAGLIFGLYLLVAEIPWMPNFALGLWSTLISLPGVMLAGWLIYKLNRKVFFLRCGLEIQQVHKMCLALAVFTAPYTMLIPLYW